MSRRSIRKLIDKDIPRDVLDVILECGYHAPSGHNLQSWKFTVITHQKDIDYLKSITKNTSIKSISLDLKIREY